MKLSIDIFYILFDYLNPNDIKNIIKTNKILYNNDKLVLYSKQLILNRCANLLINFWKRYISITKIFRNNIFEYNITRRVIAFIFFKNYEKELIKIWYNNEIEWKKEILDKYKIKYTDYPTRLDIYKLILRIPVSETLSLGW